MSKLLDQVLPSGSCGHWHLSVAKGSQSVHPMGQPINHSTHSGLSLPPAPCTVSQSVVPLLC